MMSGCGPPAHSVSRGAAGHTHPTAADRPPVRLHLPLVVALLLLAFACDQPAIPPPSAAPARAASAAPPTVPWSSLVLVPMPVPDAGDAPAEVSPGWTCFKSYTTRPIWSPIGSRLAISCHAGLEVFDVPGLRLVGRRPAGTRGVAFRADGAALAVATDRGLLAWDLASDVLVPITAVSVDGRPFALSPDWRRLAAVDARGVVAVFDTASGSKIATLAGGRALGDVGSSEPEVGLSWSPDGARIATASNRVEVWDATTGSALGAWTLPVGEVPAREPSLWAADGATVFFSALKKNASRDVEEEYTGRLHAGDARTFKLRRAWNTLEFTISPDGKTLFCSGRSELYRINVATGARRDFDFPREGGAPYIHSHLALSGDGRWFTAIRGQLGGNYIDAFDTSLMAPTSLE